MTNEEIVKFRESYTIEIVLCVHEDSVKGDPEDWFYLARRTINGKPMEEENIGIGDTPEEALANFEIASKQKFWR